MTLSSSNLPANLAAAHGKPVVLPQHILKLVPAAIRAQWGKSGLTAEEAEAVCVAKTEAQLQALIQTMLQRNGIYVVRQRMDRKSNIAIGTPDLLFAVKGQPIAWEVKLPGKNPTAEQYAAMEEMRANGWKVAIVRSYDEALKLFRELSTTTLRTEDAR